MSATDVRNFLDKRKGEAGEGALCELEVGPLGDAEARKAVSDHLPVLARMDLGMRKSGQ